MKVLSPGQGPSNALGVKNGDGSRKAYRRLTDALNLSNLCIATRFRPRTPTVGRECKREQQVVEG